jgi:hypothetical protein
MNTSRITQWKPSGLFLAAAAVLAVSGSLFAQHTVVDFDRTVDLSKLKTYRWLPLDQPPIFKGGLPETAQTLPDATADKIIKKHVSDQLNKKGFQEIAEGEPDFLVSYFLSMALDFEVQEFDTGTSPNPDIPYGHWRPFYSTMYDQILLRTGTLSIDVISPEDEKLIWRGTATETFDEKGNVSVKKADKRVQKAVKKILKKFPPD